MFTISTFKHAEGYNVDSASFSAIDETLSAPKWASLINVTMEN